MVQSVVAGGGGGGGGGGEGQVPETADQVPSLQVEVNVSELCSQLYVTTVP